MATASTTTARPTLASARSFEDASRLVGELSADGTASLRADMSLNMPNGSHRATLGRALSDRPSSIASSTTTSDEDYDIQKADPATFMAGSRGGGLEIEGNIALGRIKDPDSRFAPIKPPPDEPKRPEFRRRKSIPVTLEKTDKKGKYILTTDEPELRKILRLGIERDAGGAIKKHRSRFSDLVFTRQFTVFDRHNSSSADSPFHGFFTLFWLGVALLLMKIAANNYKEYGSIFGRNEILQLMFHRDVLVLGISDGVLCGITGVCLVLQKIVHRGWLSWDRSGWIIQNVWQTFYIAAAIGWTLYREWPWTHTVFIVLHCITMLMKQHSYAFYNGHLSEVYKRRQILENKLVQLEDYEPAIDPIDTPTAPVATSYLDRRDLGYIHQRRRSVVPKSPGENNVDKDLSSVAAAIESQAPLDSDQIHAFQRLIKLEIEGLTDELRGKCSVTKNYYPTNLTWKNFYEYIPLPTLVYELEYPRQEKIDWWYVAEKTAAIFGVIGVMIVVSQAYIYPVVMRTVAMKDSGMPLLQRLEEFPWVLSDLIFPFMMEYLLSWYVIWEAVLNLLAELTLFADRGFYADWWNSVSWDAFARDWNRPVHNFLLRHVYHSSISALHLSKSSATLMTFFLSACVHELVMWCIFKKLRGYLLFMQMMQLPLVALSRTRLLKGRTVLGNVVFWLGIFTGPSFLCSLYLII